jgi:hypothetical protein
MEVPARGDHRVPLILRRSTANPFPGSPALTDPGALSRTNRARDAEPVLDDVVQDAAGPLRFTVIQRGFQYEITDAVCRPLTRSEPGRRPDCAEGSPHIQRWRNRRYCHPRSIARGEPVSATLASLAELISLVRRTAPKRRSPPTCPRIRAEYAQRQREGRPRQLLSPDPGSGTGRYQRRRNTARRAHEGPASHRRAGRRTSPRDRRRRRLRPRPVQPGLEDSMPRSAIRVTAWHPSDGNATQQSATDARRAHTF